MARSLSLSAYLAFARRSAADPVAPDHPRPTGPLLWLHSADPRRAGALAQMALRFASQRDALTILITVSPGRPKPRNLPEGVILQIAPSEHPAEVRAFLDHWQPDVAVWLGPWLRPALIHGASERKIPLLLADASELGLEHRHWRWLPDPIRGTVQLFDRILANGATEHQRIMRLIGREQGVTESGDLVEESPALPCIEDDLEELTAALAGRPVWLAARVQPNELDILLTAHRTVSRISPRLLMILVPENAQDAPEFKTRCEAADWRVSDWDAAEMPQENTQILLAENRGELGTFYRAAPITLMGCSLMPAHGGRNPFEAAALGSAVLYGPSVRSYLQAYGRLAEAGAARSVRDAESLSAALAELMAPEQVAVMAHAGWETVSAGAEVVDQIIALLHEAFDGEDWREVP